MHTGAQPTQSRIYWEKHTFLTSFCLKSAVTRKEVGAPQSTQHPLPIPTLDKRPPTCTRTQNTNTIQEYSCISRCIVVV